MIGFAAKVDASSDIVHKMSSILSFTDSHPSESSMSLL